MMNDMTQAMGNVTEQVSRGELPPDRRQQMAERMGPLSMMMRRVSGLAARPAMKDQSGRTNGRGAEANG
jgi:hypothetical protein